MTLQTPTLIGTYTGTCYKELLTDLNLETEFNKIAGEKLRNHELTRDSISEDTLIHETLEKADAEYILHSDVTGQHEQMYYAVYQP